MSARSDGVGVTNHRDEKANVRIETDVRAHEVEPLLLVSNGILNGFDLHGHDLNTSK